MIANIVPATKTIETDTFSYLVPKELEDHIRIGSIVQIPFGRRTLRGVVLAIDSQKEMAAPKLKAISSVNKQYVLPKPYQKIARWISDHYLCSMGEAVSLFLPAILKRPRKAVLTETHDLANLPDLNLEQEGAFRQILNQADQQKPFLLFGVTGSGKTEIYIRLAKEIIDQKKQVVILVPEILQTPQALARFKEIFGEEITLMHSHLSKSEKAACYADFYSGRKNILIGPRSALLVPSQNLGLIVVDEEHDDSYKQEQTPRYHAVSLAVELAKETKALLVMGSATPTVKSYYQAQKDEYILLTLLKRHSETLLPSSKIVDLRNELRSGNYSPVSLELQKAIGECLANKKQILLFLNRRGTSTFVSCRDCGFVILCKQCSIPMVYHLHDNSGSLSCHHCDAKSSVPLVCPSCGSLKLKYFGSGVEKVEREINRLFPDARSIRIDSTTVRSKSDYENIYNKMKGHEVDILIGTQMIAKGLDIPNVDLVGVVSADTGLHLPHYQAFEKSFQLLTQVCGRAGRRKTQGKAIIQTYWPEASAIVSASQHDFIGFFDREIETRRKFDYPPFTHLVRIIAENADCKKAECVISSIAELLRKRGIDFIGPGKCFYEKLHGKFRYHILIKFDKMVKEDAAFLKSLKNVIIDADPANLL